jgi:hypothetical protein
LSLTNPYIISRSNASSEGEGSMAVQVVERLNKILESFLFRIITLLIGLTLCAFYGILMLAAFINLPDSWLGVLYSLGGLTSGMLCFIYVDNPRKRNFFFVIIVPFLMCMILTFLSES